VAIRLSDVARKAGVSSGTVSRVLNGAKGHLPISVATRERVLAAAEMLEYRPNLTARSLSTRQTQAIGVVLPLNAMSLQAAYNAKIVAGIGAVLAARGYSLILYFSEFGRLRVGPDYATLLQDGRVDGGLVVDSALLTDDQLADLERQADRLPFVLVGHRLPDSRLQWVAADDRGGGGAATRHLLELGHRRIAHLQNKEGQPVWERYLGYRDALTAGGIEVDPEWLIPRTAPERLGAVLRSKAPPTAVFAWNDYAALQMIRVLHGLGMKVPDDVSVVGYDDYEVAELALPSLTTIREPLYELGVAAAEGLMNLLSGGAPAAQRVEPTKLVVRESTGPPK